jgi:hypothetical protein
LLYTSLGLIASCDYDSSDGGFTHYRTIGRQLFIPWASYSIYYSAFLPLYFSIFEDRILTLSHICQIAYFIVLFLTMGSHQDDNGLDSKHSTISPAIFYWGTPVVLITTENPDSTFNIAPMSSAWWLGNRCMLGLGAISQTTINLLRTKQCVLNLASDNMSDAINALALTTGSK